MRDSADDGDADRDAEPGDHLVGLRDRDALEHRGPHTSLRELGEERHRLDEHAETLHARLLDDRARAFPARRAVTTASTAPAATAVRSTTP